MRGSLAVVLAYGLDGALGEPPNVAHPVAWMGSVIARAKRWALRGTKLGQLARGASIAVVLPSLFAACAWVLLHSVVALPAIELVLAVLLLKPMFAIRSLRDAAFAVRDALDRTSRRHAARSAVFAAARRMT
jgi:adenosylcobinamide-phosphate synthase